MGMGKSSGSSQAQLTPEQRQLLQVQTNALTGTFLPAYQKTIGQAQNVMNQVNPAATSAAQTAMDVGQRAGALQESGGTQAYKEGLGGSSQLAGYQTGLGQGLAGQGAGGLSRGAESLTGAGQNAYGTGFGGAASIANQQANVSNALMGQGAGGLTRGAENLANIGQQGYGSGFGGSSSIAGQQSNIANALIGQGAGGVGSLSGYQAGLGAGLTGQGASQLSQLFSPQFKQEQINAALQPATEDIRDQMTQQGALFGGAGGLGSSRQALASRNLASLGQARLGNIAAQTSAGVEAQRQQAANTLLGAGQTATGQAQQGYQNLLGAGQGAAGTAANVYGNILNQGANLMGQSNNAYQALLGAGQGAAGTAGNLYSNILGQGAGLMGQGTNAYGQLLGAGQTALGAGQQGYGNIANLGQQGLAAAQQSAASRIGYAQTPQDVLAKYAQVIYGTPQSSTTPNFAGTQGQTTSGKGMGFKLS